MVHARHAIVHRRGRFALVLLAALFGREMAHGAVIHLGRGLALAAMARMVLRGERGGQQHGPGEKHRADHAPSPAGNGRTVTTCIIPACMW